MKAEISFLMDLFLDDEVPSPVKKKIANRMREVEKYLTSPQVQVTQQRYSSSVPPAIASASPVIAAQSPSMQRLMANNPDLVPKAPMPVTPEAAAALAKRQEILLGAGKEKPDKGRTSPRKF